MVRFSGRVLSWVAAVAVTMAIFAGCVDEGPRPEYPSVAPAQPTYPQGPHTPSDVHPLDREPVRPNRPSGPNHSDTVNVRLDTPWLDPSVPIGAMFDVQMDLPLDLRTKNWGGGSCVHASTVNLLRWQGQDEMADWWRKTYIGGEYADRLIQRLESAGLRYAYTTKGDFEFLKWCCRTRRGAGIFYKPSHSINCVGIDQQYVYLLDNNATNYPEQKGHYEQVPVQQFVSSWKGYGGFAWTLVYSPPPPNPVVVQRWWDVPQ